MIKTAVDIDKWNYANQPTIELTSYEPTWAYNYLRKNEILDLLLMLKKTKRKDAYIDLLTVAGKAELAQGFECNAKGQVVFKWEKARDKTLFILKWS